MSDKKEVDKIVDLIVARALLKSFESVMNESQKELEKEKRKIDLRDLFDMLIMVCLFFLLLYMFYKIHII